MRPVLLLALLFSACASPVASRGSLPAPPTEADLRNDGSAAEKDRLLQHYGVRMAQERVEVADARRPARAGVVGTGVDGDVEAYLGPQFPVGGAGLRTALGASGLALMGLSTGLLFLAMPIPFVLGLGTVSAVDLMTRSFVREPSTRPAAIQLNIIISILGTVAVSATGGMVVLPGLALLATGILMVEQARRMTLSALTDAAGAFNADLQSRITALSSPPEPEPEPEPESSPPPLAPASQPPPAVENPANAEPQ